MGKKLKIEAELDRDSLIRVLEEESGLRVRVCGNCRLFQGISGFQQTLDVQACGFMAGKTHGGLAFPDSAKDGFFAACKNNGWEPKEK